jgi:hypothetical protein
MGKIGREVGGIIGGGIGQIFGRTSGRIGERLGRAAGYYLSPFKQGGRITMFDGIKINPKAFGGADRAIGMEDTRVSAGPGPYVPFRRGGKIRKGISGMRRKSRRRRG